MRSFTIYAMRLKQIPYLAYQRWVASRLLMRRYDSILARNRALRHLRDGKRCFIIGNGPSVKQQDLVKLKNEETFVVNSFWHHPQYRDIQPKYYFVIDSENFPTQEGDDNAWSQDLIARNDAIQACPTKLCFHVMGKPFIERRRLYEKNQIYYLAFHGWFRENLTFNIELDKVLPNVKNVIIACIIAAAYMGFEEIYLLGCEHDFLAYPSNRHYEGFKHFYETKQFDLSDKDEVRHYALAAHSYERHIDNVKILFRNYRLLARKLSLTHPRLRIFNATPNSFLDVFPMIDFNDIRL